MAFAAARRSAWRFTALEREWRRSVREQTGLALLMVDVDNFKAFNDRYGHRHGDEVLTTIAHAIEAQVVRPGDVAARNRSATAPDAPATGSGTESELGRRRN